MNNIFNKALFLFLILISFFYIISIPCLAQDKDNLQTMEEKLEVTVIKILEEQETSVEGKIQLYQKLEAKVTNGSLEGKIIVLENGNMPVTNIQKYKTGDSLIVNKIRNAEGENVFYITDFVRRKPLLVLFAIFVMLTILIGRIRGVMSLFGMGVTFLIIFYFILPRILSGADPVMTAIFGACMIIPVTFYLSHGFNKKSSIAIAGTVVSLVFTAILASVFVEAVKLTGFASDEASFLQVMRQDTINIKGMLLAGIIIGVLGVLDDITVSQSAIVFQLNRLNKNLRPSQLYLKAMDVGKDHIASMVNTLILVYTGASLPLLLLFLDTSDTFFQVINYEIIADEIVRTLVGSIGLVFAVPITTFLAVLSTVKKS